MTYTENETKVDGSDEMPLTEQSATLSLSSQKHVGFTFGSAELALSIDKFLENAIKEVLDVSNLTDDEVMTLWRAMDGNGPSRKA